MVGQSQFTRKDFLDAIFSQYYREHRGFILVKVVKSEEAKVATRYFPNIEVLGREIYGEDSDVYFGICPRERMKPEKEHVKFILALWGDIDIGPEAHEKGQQFYRGPEEAAKAIRDFPLPPSITVDSGHGLHLYWLLDRAIEATEPAAIEEVISKVQAGLKCRMNANLDALMRLPDTYNNKVMGSSRLCSVKFINVNFRYALGDFKHIAQATGTSSAHTLRRFEPETLIDEQMGGSSTPERPTVLPSQKIRTIAPPSDQPRNSTGYQAESPDLLETSIPPENLVEVPQTLTRTQAPPDFGVYTLTKESRPAQKASENAFGTEKNQGLFSHLISDGTVVEIAFNKTDQVMKCKIEWVSREWIGVREGSDCYAIPINSILFIRYKE